MSGSSRRPAVFLDRDGVLTLPLVRAGRPYPPLSVEELRLFPDAPGSCTRLRTLGFAVVVVTNQPDIARGRLDPAALDAIHRELRRRVEIDALYLCPHDDRDRCGCRKPAPGMLRAAADDLGLDLGKSFMVGDRWRDVEAGRRAGCTTVHVERGYAERAPEPADFVAGGLVQAVRWIEESVGVEGVIPG